MLDLISQYSFGQINYKFNVTTNLHMILIWNLDYWQILEKIWRQENLATDIVGKIRHQVFGLARFEVLTRFDSAHPINNAQDFLGFLLFDIYKSQDSRRRGKPIWTPFYHIHQPLQHICRKIAAESSPLHIDTGNLCFLSASC